MDHSDIPKLRALREEYIHKYNANYSLCNWWFNNNPAIIGKRYKITLWGRVCSPPYDKYDIDRDHFYTIAEIETACWEKGKHINIPEKQCTLDISRIIYHNENKKWKQGLFTRQVCAFADIKNIDCKFADMSFEEYIKLLKQIENSSHPEVAGYKKRQQQIYLCIIDHIDYSIDCCKRIINTSNNQIPKIVAIPA